MAEANIEFALGVESDSNMQQDVTKMESDSTLPVGLNPRQRAFVVEYLKDKNATQAYLRAGYVGTEDSARANAARLIAQDSVASEIDRLERARLEQMQAETGITLERTLREIARRQCEDPRLGYDYRAPIARGGSASTRVYAQCTWAKSEVGLRKFEGGKLVSFVLSANLHRRHMTPGQQAAIVASAQDWAKAQTVGRPGNGQALDHFATVTQRAAASGTSRITQMQADKVAKADPELAKKVAHGEVSLPKADKLATLHFEPVVADREWGRDVRAGAGEACLPAMPCAVVDLTPTPRLRAGQWRLLTPSLAH